MFYLQISLFFTNNITVCLKPSDEFFVTDYHAKCYKKTNKYLQISIYQLINDYKKPLDVNIFRTYINKNYKNKRL